jgi:hypothetical protein
MMIGLWGLWRRRDQWRYDSLIYLLFVTFLLVRATLTISLVQNTGQASRQFPILALLESQRKNLEIRRSGVVVNDQRYVDHVPVFRECGTNLL